MRRLTRLALRRPKLAVGIWLVAMLLLAGAGADVQDKVSETSFDLSGTESKRALDAGREAFGRSEFTPILLEGPAAEIEGQGPRLAGALREQGSVVSPWDSGEGLDRLRPEPGSALILLNLGHEQDEKSEDMLKPVQAAIDENVDSPVSAHLTGLPALTDALNEATIDANDEAAKLAFPALLIVLLLIFRSVVAAAIPAIVGFATVIAGTGVIASLTESYDLTALSVSLVSMMGLALGVDYTLLIVSRFREELAGGADKRSAAEKAAATAGRTVLFAGTALAVAMFLAVLLSPGDILVSAATGVVVAVVLSTVTAAFFVPAVLALLGHNINKGRIGRLEPRRSLPTGIAQWAMKRPVLVVSGLLIALLVLAFPATDLKTDPSNVRLLQDDNQARVDYQAVEDTFGPGYVSPFEITLTGAQGAIDESRVEALAEQIARDPAVGGVLTAAGTGVRLISSAGADPNGGAGEAAGAASAFVLNEDRTAARVFVFPRTFPNSPEARDLMDRLETQADAVGGQIGATAAVGGLSGRFIDYDKATASRLPVLIVALALVTYLLLVPLLRAVVLPAAAILLNLVIVAAAFGALALLFGQSDPPLGGPGFLDVISLIGIFTVMFALSIDYEVFLLSRIREGYLRTGDTHEAIVYGVSRTARVVTGAALIMCAVFLAFAVSDFVTISQFGVGLTVAVLLDAMVLRLMLLPATMRLLGDRSWWLPDWLERRLPRFDVDAPSRPAAPEPASPTTAPGPVSGGS